MSPYRTFAHTAFALAASLASLVWISCGGFAAEPVKTAVFPFELVDSSMEGSTDGVRGDQSQRLLRATQQLTEGLAASGRFAVVDSSPAIETIRGIKSVNTCNDCIGDLAKSVGADVVFTGYIQKVSNLILNVNVIEWDGKTGKQLDVWSADIRGNTDESWGRGVRYILVNRILKP